MTTLLHNEVRAHHNVVADYSIVFNVGIKSDAAARAQVNVSAVAEKGAALNINILAARSEDIAATPNPHCFSNAPARTVGWRKPPGDHIVEDKKELMFHRDILLRSNK